MLQDSDFEFFQELDPLYYDPAKEEVAQTIDSHKKTEEKAHNIDTPHMTFSPQGWEQFADVNSPLPQTSFYNITPNGPLSPNDKLQVELDNAVFNLPETDKCENLFNQEKSLDINSLPMVIAELASDNATNMNSWQNMGEVEWPNTPDTHFNLIYADTFSTDPFINTDDSLDLKFGSVMPSNVDTNTSVSEYDKPQEYGAMQTTQIPKRGEGLTVDVSSRAPVWPGEISTPVILSQVISLEKETTQIMDPPDPWLLPSPPSEDYPLKTSPQVDYEPITPKSECPVGSDNDDSKSNIGKRRRHDSEDSDETYTPHSEQPSRKYKRRKPSVPIKDLILALESQPKARRGRPPKRRESTVSSVCSVDDNSSSSTPSYKYRELRDKNNEASKRSRMNRKLKEQQMDVLATELEEKNKILRVRAGILEEMTVKLKDALMSAMLKK